MAARGPVVYVLRNVSVLDYLALNHLTHRLDLPRIGFANELPPALRPQGWGDSPADQLRKTIRSGASAALFLKRPPRSLNSGVQRGRSEGDALLSTLLDLQRGDLEHEVMLMPQMLVWSKRPQRRGFSLVDSMFGPTDFPGDLRQVGQALLNYKNCELRAGDPVSLRDFLKQEGDDQNAAVVRRLTYALLRKVERDRRSILGPARKAPDRVREEVLRSPKLQKVIRELAGPGAAERAVITDKARAMLRELQTAPDPETQNSLELVVDSVVDHLYTALDVDLEGIERLREATVQGSVVLLPTHKSHVDYVMLSYVLRKNAIQTPIIAAGDNLAFFPLGPVLRRAGAFFIRRSFRGDRLYTAVVDAYIRRLMREGWLLEFFLEGGRSRTGKLLPPMLGLLNMVVAAGLGLEGRRVFFVPVSIGYERLMEEGAFERELSGIPKRTEDVLGLLKASGVLAEGWGRVNIQFGEVIDLEQVRQELGVDAADMKPAKRRAIVKHIAHRAMGEINRVTALTPGALVALVLLSQGRRGIAYRELVDQCRGLANMLLRLGARPTPTLSSDGRTLREGAAREALRLYVKSGLLEQHVPGDTLTSEGRKRAALYSGSDVIFRVPDAKRLRLDFAKNTVIHMLMDRALIAVALLGPGDTAETDRATLRSRVQDLSRLFKYEVMFRADVQFSELFDAALTDMQEQGELHFGEEFLAAGDGFAGLTGAQWLSFYAAVARNFVEAYLIAAGSLRALLKGPAETKDVVARALRNGERMFLKGEIERSEAVSRPMMLNALRAFADLGYVVRNKEELELADSFASESGVRAIEARIAAYLVRV